MGATPAAIAAARRLRFYDHPHGYHQHQAPTPLLGGTAVVVGFLLGALAVGVTGNLLVLLACAVGLWLVGTLDDWLPVAPVWRVLAETAAALVLMSAGLGGNVGRRGRRRGPDGGVGGRGRQRLQPDGQPRRGVRHRRVRVVGGGRDPGGHQRAAEIAGLAFAVMAVRAWRSCAGTSRGRRRSSSATGAAGRSGCWSPVWRWQPAAGWAWGMPTSLPGRCSSAS